MITERPIAAGNPKAIDPARLAGVKPGFLLLLEAHDFARLSGRDLWDFAIEMAALREVGLSANGLRWMMCGGYTEHAREVKSPDAQRRRFCRQPALVFAKRSCFVLTETGVRFARELIGRSGVERP